MSGEAILGYFRPALGAWGRVASLLREAECLAPAADLHPFCPGGHISCLTCKAASPSPSPSATATCGAGKGPTGPRGQRTFHSARRAGEHVSHWRRASGRWHPSLHLLAMLDGSTLPEALPPCTPGLSTTGWVLTARRTRHGGLAQVHTSSEPLGSVVTPPTPSIALSLRLCVTVTVPLAD